VKVARCFSVVRNISFLSARSPKYLPYLDGVRVMSFAVLILGHTVLVMFQSDNLGEDVCLLFLTFNDSVRMIVSNYAMCCIICNV